MRQNFENALSNSIFSSNPEKSFVDKVLSRKDVEEIRDIVKKKRLAREDLMHLMYMLNSVEVKLANYGEWDRYIMAKYFVWIRDFVAICESIMDYKEQLEKKESQKMIVITKRTWRIFENNLQHLEHTIKFLVDLYFNLGRSTLSLGGTGFLELIKNKYEVVYPQDSENIPYEAQKGVNFKWRR